VVVRQFGKEVIHCEGDCLSCGYFEKFLGSQSDFGNTEEISEGKSAKRKSTRLLDISNNPTLYIAK